MTRRDERNAFTYERWNDVNYELVNFANVEKRSDDTAAAHHPNVFALLRAQPFREFPDRFFDELKSVGNFLRRLTRENVVLDVAHVRRRLSFFLKAQNQVVSFSSPQNRVY